ncbi:MAG: hypothetical protein COB35_04840 [Gammaproteobacteria bacterium]|nr:MAG: hypothetical protein COB35_04840 [Gammaproteobacteria bacterium]
MKKLQQEHLEAVIEIVASSTADKMIDVLSEILTELPSEFNEVKLKFEDMQFSFNQCLEKTINKYVDD